MHSKQEHPGVSASHHHGRSYKKETIIHSCRFKRSNGESQQRHPLDQYHRDLREFHAGQQPQRHYELQSGHVTDTTLQQPRVLQHSSRHLQPVSAYRARRTSHVIDGVLHANATVPLAAGRTPTRSSHTDAQDDHDLSELSDSDDSRLTDTSFTGMLLRRKPPYQHTATLELLEGRPRDSPLDKVPNPQLNRNLPYTPAILEAGSPDVETWGPPINPFKPRLWHHELFFEQGVQHSLRPREVDQNRQTPLDLMCHARQSPLPEAEARREPAYELEGSHPQLPVLHDIRHITSAQLAALNAWHNAGHVEELAEAVAVPRQDFAVPSQTGTAPVLSSDASEQQQSTAPLYERYTKMRGWDFEDVEEEYNKLVRGLATPPSSPRTKDIGGFEWFYGGNKK
jgi:hypothetical protein